MNHPKLLAGLAPIILTGSFIPNMAVLSDAHLAFVFGILGNCISCVVYLAPLPTFYHIFQRKSTLNYQSIPYSVALFSAMLMLYYAHLKGNAVMLISINAIGCGIEAIYLVTFFIFANTCGRTKIAKLIVVFNTGVYFLLVLLTSMVSPKSLRLKIVGWICAAFSICVFAAPLSIMRLVIQTRSVEFMPLPLSLCLTVSGIVWLFYGVFIHDYFVAAPNILGLLFGAAQIILYFFYRNCPATAAAARSEDAPPSLEMQNVEVVESMRNRTYEKNADDDNDNNNIQDNDDDAIYFDDNPNYFGDHDDDDEDIEALPVGAMLEGVQTGVAGSNIQETHLSAVQEEIETAEITDLENTIAIGVEGASTGARV